MQPATHTASQPAMQSDEEDARELAPSLRDVRSHRHGQRPQQQQQHPSVIICLTTRPVDCEHLTLAAPPPARVCYSTVYIASASGGGGGGRQ